MAWANFALWLKAGGDVCELVQALVSSVLAIFYLDLNDAVLLVFVLPPLGAFENECKVGFTQKRKVFNAEDFLPVGVCTFPGDRISVIAFPKRDNGIWILRHWSSFPGLIGLRFGLREN
jgi:hypothetical protein